MSYIKNDLTENNNSLPESKFQNKNISYISEKSKQIKVPNRKYKYNYSNRNNYKKEEKYSKIEQNDNNNNIKYIKAKNISISPNRRSFQSHSKLNCETNYSINKMTNTYYVNGLNKNIAKININRSPDLKFIPFQNKNNYVKKNFLLNNINKKHIIKDNSLITNIKNINRNDNNIINTQYISDEESKDQINNINENLKENTILTNNHNFKSISNCSNKNPEIISNPLPKNKKYKCDIKIHNLNEQKKENIRSHSYDDSYNSRSKTKTKIFTHEYNKEYQNLEYEFNRHKSFDKNYLKMQNSQNIQILQEEKIYQLLIPIPPNEIDYICNFHINSIEKNEKKSRKEINLENEKETSKIKNINYINKNIKYVKKTNWNKIISPKKKKNQDLEIENFSINYEETLRKFKDEMFIEKTDLTYERSPRNWNDSLQPRSNDPLSIEREKNKNKTFSETSVEKLTYKGNIPISNRNKNWNQINNKEKVQNINLIMEKPNKILSEQNKEKFYIKGQLKNWNNALSTKEENKFSIKSVKDKNKDEIEESEEKNIIEDDEIEQIMKRKINVDITREIKNGVESSETSSEYDVLKKINQFNNNKYENLIKNSFNSNKYNRKVIINNISKKYSKEIDMNYEIDQNNNKNTLNIKKEEKNNLKIEFPEPQISVNSGNIKDNIQDNVEYNYRESIVNKEIFIREKYQKKVNEDDNLDSENDIERLTSETKGLSEINSNNLEENQSNNQTYEFPSPKSDMRFEYREEIISLSPKRDKLEEINKINLEDMDNNNINENIKNEGINLMEEEYKNYISNNENQDIYSSNLEEEKKINPREREIMESNIINNNRNDSNFISNEKKHRIQYIYKNKINKSKKNKNKTFNKQIEITNQNNVNTEQIIFNNNKSNTILKNEADYNINNPPEEKHNLITNGEKVKKSNNENSRGLVQENNFNIIYNSRRNRNDKNNNLKNLNENILERSNGLNKSQIMKKNNNINNQFGINSKINYGNIVLNNTLKRKPKNMINNENNENEERSLIHHYENSKDNNKSNDKNNNNFQNQYSNLSSKIRILKK